MEVKLIDLILFQFHPWIKIVKKPPAELGIGLDQGKLNINVIQTVHILFKSFLDFDYIDTDHENEEEDEVLDI